MRTRIRLFAGLADAFQASEIALDIPEGATVANLRKQIETLYPDFASLIEPCLIAVNRAYATEGQLLQTNDEIALIPPVGGGSPRPEAEEPCRITASPLSVQQAFMLLEGVHQGGTVLFCGTVREWTQGRQTIRLSYEAYTEMALDVMQRIRADVESEFPGVRTLQWHRIGDLIPTEIAVICGASAPHRDAAFAAARTLIDRLKREVPIWKKEIFADGQEIWQANPSS